MAALRTKTHSDSRSVDFSALFIADLRRPERSPSRAPYLYRKVKETHELIFSWLSWLAVLLVGVYAGRRGQSGGRGEHVRFG